LGGKATGRYCEGGREMDYDATAIPEAYPRARALPARVMRLWQRAVRRAAPLRPGSTVVDAGCGAGRFSVALASGYANRVIGLDRSARMLAQTRSRHARVSFCVADVQQLPIRQSSVSMVFLSNVVHHLSDLQGAAAGFARVLERPGFVVVRNYVRERLASVPYLEFFPEAHAASLAMLPSAGEVVAAFERAGLKLVSAEMIEQPVASSPGEYLSKVRSRVYSDLATISDDAFEAGVTRMADAVSSGWRRALCEPISLFAFAPDYPSRPTSK